MGNMSITGLYGYTVCQIIIYDSVGDSKFGMGVLHVKREILTYLFWRNLSVWLDIFIISSYRVS